MRSVELAMEVVRKHEQLVRAGDLDAIMANVADDVVVLAPNAPLAEGKAAFRAMYEAFLRSGVYEYDHDYHGAETAGDIVVLHGLASGTFTPHGAPATQFANNFLHVLKRGTGGKYQFWRIAFAPTE